VKAGEYASADEAVNSLLSFVTEQDRLTPEQHAELQAQIAVGIEQAERGELSEWDAEAVWAEVERRHADGSKKAG
jgi:Arc/MetJ-type ribon-helix-helix transcriptional regulator